MNGDQNLWIIKPGHQSRGRGIVLMSNYYEILKYIRESRGRNWVIQKYIERPLLINKKKFDIRQWVLVTDWNPLTVWIYKESYVRFAMMDYDPTKRVKYSHLTNNCLAYKFKNQQQSG
jgi:tubulin monoglycylase TTLL3/8